MNILRIIGLLKQIEEPPPLDKESLFGEWAESTADIMAQVADTIEDEKGIVAARMFTAMVNEDDLWSRLYDLLKDARKRIDVKQV